MQDQTTKVFENIQSVLNRLPEFDKISLTVITAEHSDDEGGILRAREASLLAGRDKGTRTMRIRPT